MHVVRIIAFAILFLSFLFTIISLATNGWIVGEAYGFPISGGLFALYLNDVSVGYSQVQEYEEQITAQLPTGSGERCRLR